MVPLNRVLRQCAISVMGLLRTVSLDAALLIAGLVPADLIIRQRTVEFFLRQLTLGSDLEALYPPCCKLNHTMSPVDVLRMELRRLDQSGFVSSDDLRRVEARHW